MDRIKRFKGSLMLLLAAFFWGTTFAAQSSAADSIPTFTFNAARSFVGAVFLGILILIRQRRSGSGVKTESRADNGSRETGVRADSGNRGIEDRVDSGNRGIVGRADNGSREAGVRADSGNRETEDRADSGSRETGDRADSGSRETGGSVGFGAQEKEGGTGSGARSKRDDSGHFPKKGAVFGGGICGVVLFAAMSFQQGGIAAYPEGAAASGRSGFLTATYVVMVAICARFLGKKLHKSVYAAVAVCIVGMYLLCMSGGGNGIYFGDVLGLVCAVFFTAHIMVVDHFSYCESVRLSCMQFLVSGILSTAAMLLFEQPDIHMLAAAVGPILYAGILSSGIAYTLQMEGQKYAEPSVAAIIMSLESVFAVLGGWIVLNERLSVRELAGCALVFAAVILAQLPQKVKEAG